MTNVPCMTNVTRPPEAPVRLSEHRLRPFAFLNNTCSTSGCIHRVDQITAANRTADARTSSATGARGHHVGAGSQDPTGDRPWRRSRSRRGGATARAHAGQSYAAADLTLLAPETRKRLLFANTRDGVGPTSTRDRRAFLVPAVPRPSNVLEECRLLSTSDHDHILKD